MSTENSNRDWEKQPCGVEDGSLFEKFEADLIDELEKDKGGRSYSVEHRGSR